MGLDKRGPFGDNRSKSLDFQYTFPTKTMSDESVVDQTSNAAPGEEAELFTRAELKAFDADDIEAGGNICKMLSLFFFYTVIVMGISTLVTYSWVSQ